MSAWGQSQEQGQSRASSGPQGQADTHYNLPSFPEDTQANSKMLNTAHPSLGREGQQPPQQQPQPSGPPQGPHQAPGPGAPQPNTSWAAAAGKGLPPSEPATNPTNGTTNKQLEQLNSVREALFSQDGWGGQNVKQDTSWDVGAPAAEPLPAAASPAAKADSMQWQAPSQGRNDGTDLWKSTLSGVPPAPKPQVATPWGNHTPTNPADYKNWGEDDGQGQGQGQSQSQNQGNGGGGFTAPEPEGPNMWNPRDMGGMSGPAPGLGPQGQPWEADRPMPQGRFDDRGQRPDWGGAPKPKENPMWDQSNNWADGPRGRGGEPNNWGPPPPGKPGTQNWGGQGGGPGPMRPQWDGDSPTMGRRFDEDPSGTSIWGQKDPSRGPAPPGGE